MTAWRRCPGRVMGRAGRCCPQGGAGSRCGPHSQTRALLLGLGRPRLDLRPWASAWRQGLGQWVHTRACSLRAWHGAGVAKGAAQGATRWALCPPRATLATGDKQSPLDRASRWDSGWVLPVLISLTRRGELGSQETDSHTATLLSTVTWSRGQPPWTFCLRVSFNPVSLALPRSWGRRASSQTKVRQCDWGSSTICPQTAQITITAFLLEN